MYPDYSTIDDLGKKLRSVHYFVDKWNGGDLDLKLWWIDGYTI